MKSNITVYGTTWCPDVRQVRDYLDSNAIDYSFIDIDRDESGEKKVLQWNNGRRRVPTVELQSGDGSKVLSVPRRNQLREELALIGIGSGK